MIKREDKVKIYKKIFKFCFWALFVTFLTLYFSQSTGYYEYGNYKKTVLTNEKIKQFELDVEKGKNVQIEDYLEDKNYNLNNKISSFGYNVSDTIGIWVKDSLDFIFNSMNSALEENE